MRLLFACALLVTASIAAPPAAQGRKYVGADGKLRVALAKQPLSPNGPSKGPDTMANGGIQKILAEIGATVRVEAAALTTDEDTEYGGWKRLGMSLGHFADMLRIAWRLDLPAKGGAAHARIGRLYRALVVGSGGHRIMVRRVLKSIARRAERVHAHREEEA